MSRSVVYLYGMRERPFSIGCQPMSGLVKHESPTSRFTEYWDLLYYDHKLSEKEREQYELIFIGRIEEK
ncbi:MAG: hypothetical protein ACI4CX_00050 [Candidatus Weimeria sp.]